MQIFEAVTIDEIFKKYRVRQSENTLLSINNIEFVTPILRK